MVKNKVINYDLENSPLRIKTDSAIGSKHIVRVYFYTSSSMTLAGGVIIRLNDNPDSYLHQCRHSYASFPTSLPEDNNRIWNITKTLNPLGIMIHCNNVEILNMQFTDKTCTTRSWKSHWDKAMKRIRFHDTASDYYLPAKGIYLTRLRIRFLKQLTA